MHIANQHRLKEEAARELPNRTSGSLGNPRRKPHYEVIDGQEVVYESVADSRGVLLLFHGCSHSAVDWWDRQDACQTCLGLPEEKAVVQAAIRRRYVVVALSSQDRAHRKCWDVGHGTTVDVQKTMASVKTLSEREGWEELPLYAMGASSGGAMVALLPFHMPLQAICVQIMGVPHSVYADISKTLGRRWPPTLWVHMPRDQHTAAAVAADVAALKKEGAITMEMQQQPLSLSPEFFSDRVEDIDAATSAELFKGLQSADLLTADLLLKADPRATTGQWQAAVRGISAANLTLDADRSAVFEELNVAWAGHELISDTTDAMLDWFEQQRSAETA